MVRVSRSGLGLAVLMTTAAAAGVAGAQSVSSDLGTTAESNFARDRSIAVRERAHPEYEAAGMRMEPP